jgi:hypothetical protein
MYGIQGFEENIVKYVSAIEYAVLPFLLKDV